MYYLTPNNTRQLTDEQIVKEMWNTTIGNIYSIFMPVPYKQPENTTKEGAIPTVQRLKQYIKSNGSADKIDN